MLINYLLALGHHWVLLVSGLVSVVVAIYERVRNKGIGTRILLGIAVACVAWASFDTWREESERANAALAANSGLNAKLIQANSELSALRIGVDERQRQINALRAPQSVSPNGAIVPPSIRQRSAGPNSPNVIVGNNSQATIQTETVRDITPKKEQATFVRRMEAIHDRAMRRSHAVALDAIRELQALGREYARRQFLTVKRRTQCPTR